MEKQPAHGQRAYYRLYYPRDARPTLKIGSDCYEVIELSEHGLRFDHGDRALKDYTDVQGIICFRDGEKQEISGVVTRRYGNETVMMMTRGVSFGRMMREQRYVLSKYTRIRTSEELGTSAPSRE